MIRTTTSVNAMCLLRCVYPNQYESLIPWSKVASSAFKNDWRFIMLEIR